MSEAKKPTLKKVIDLIIVLLTALASFLGGNAVAQNGYKVFPTEQNTPWNISDVSLT